MTLTASFGLYERKPVLHHAYQHIKVYVYSVRHTSAAIYEWKKYSNDRSTPRFHNNWIKLEAKLLTAGSSNFLTFSSCGFRHKMKPVRICKTSFKAGTLDKRRERTVVKRTEVPLQLWNRSYSQWMTYIAYTCSIQTGLTPQNQKSYQAVQLSCYFEYPGQRFS